MKGQEIVSMVLPEVGAACAACECPLLAGTIGGWAEALSEAEQRRLLLPLLPGVANARGSEELYDRRNFILLDWTIRDCFPTWLDAGTKQLQKEAQRLRRLARVASDETFDSAARAFDEVIDRLPRLNRWHGRASDLSAVAAAIEAAMNEASTSTGLLPALLATTEFEPNAPLLNGPQRMAYRLSFSAISRAARAPSGQAADFRAISRAAVAPVIGRVQQSMAALVERMAAAA